MRHHDWAASGLGEPGAWPESLKTVTRLMLCCKTPVFLAWGPELCFLYNDAYLAILGNKHPASLGRPFFEVWQEIKAELQPLVDKALAGEAVHFENFPFRINRTGKSEQAWFNFSYTPVEGADEKICGLYCALTETTARMVADKDRQRQTQRMRSLFEQAPGFMAVVREPGHVYELANSAYLRLVGRQALVGKPFRDVFQKIQAHDYLALLDQVYASGQPFIGKRMPLIVAHQASGQPEQRYVDFIFQPIADASGAVNGIFIEGSDVTEHARAIDALQESRRGALETAQRLDALLQAAPVGIALADTQGRLLRVNAASRLLWGVAPEDDSVHDYAQWKGWWADDASRHGQRLEAHEWAATLQSAGASHDTVEIEPFDAPGVRRTILNCSAAVRNSEAQVIGSVIAQMDITALVKTQAALRGSVARYQKITNSIPQMVWATLPDGCHVYFNQQWYDYTGVAQGSTDGEGWKQLFHPEDQEEAAKKWRHSLASGEPYEVEYRLRHHSGEYRWTLGRALPVRSKGGLISRWMGTCTDIHEQKLAQEALQQASRLKDEFLAMLAHELRNPLAPIATAAELLSMGTLDKKGVHKLSEVISRQSRHMTRLIDDLLDVSRVTRGQVTLEHAPVDLKSVIAEALEQVKPLAEAKGHHLEIQQQVDYSLVTGDRLRLVQVLANVLNNAIKYTPNGGHIAVCLAEEKSQLTLSVQDNGIGMSGHLIGLAFELFTQGERTSDRSQGGLGIGLALVRSLVQLHGGAVRLESGGPNQGSKLTMTLPRLALQSDQQGQPGGDGGGAHAAPESLRILVVDDNVDAARLLGMFVELLGHEVFVQFHPATALECARKVMPHVCLLDIGLPDMDGYALARQLRLIPGMQTAVLAAVTGYSQPQDKQAAFAAGFNFHFAKPIDTRQLESWLADAGAQAAGPGNAGACQGLKDQSAAA